MSVTFINDELPGVIVIEPAVFGDDRGFFMETYHRKKYEDGGIGSVFVQDNHSHSRRGILRGLHYQLKNPQAKLMYVVSGEIFDVAVDIRRGSPTFGQWTGAVLSGKNHKQMFIPEGFAHGFCVLSETADVIYKCSDLYAPGDEYGILWNDPDINIQWPINDPFLSEKDRVNPRLAEAPEAHLPVYEL